MHEEKKENLCNHKSSREERGFWSDRMWMSDLNGGMMIEWEAAETTLSYPHLLLLFDSLVIFRSRIVTLGCYLRVCQTHTLLVLFWNNFLFALFWSALLQLCLSVSCHHCLHFIFFFCLFFWVHLITLSKLCNLEKVPQQLPIMGTFLPKGMYCVAWSELLSFERHGSIYRYTNVCHLSFIAYDICCSLKTFSTSIL